MSSAWKMALMAVVVMAGCREDESYNGTGPEACLNEEIKALVGQPEAAAVAILPELSRIIPPNSAITQDHRPDRVNVDLDDAGTVTRVWCG